MGPAGPASLPGGSERGSALIAAPDGAAAGPPRASSGLEEVRHGSGGCEVATSRGVVYLLRGGSRRPLRSRCSALQGLRSSGDPPGDAPAALHRRPAGAGAPDSSAGGVRAAPGDDDAYTLEYLAPRPFGSSDETRGPEGARRCREACMDRGRAPVCPDDHVDLVRLIARLEALAIEDAGRAAVRRELLAKLWAHLPPPPVVSAEMQTALARF